MNNVAKKIMIIRHGEKPIGTIVAITAEGVEDPESLIVQGWQRAGGLVGLFDPFNKSFQNSDLATPNKMYASHPKSGNESHKEYSKSKRPLETLTPLSQRLGLTIDQNHGAEEFPDMIDKARNHEGVVIIAWQHSDIPAMANLLLNNTSAPQKWPGHRFDVVWIFDLDASTGLYNFKQIPQNLIAGDTNTVIE